MSYIVLALPRSRTAWLSRFLTYGDWTCGHEELRYMRSVADVQACLARSRHGSAETAAMSGWRLLETLSPATKIVIIRRPVGEVVDSLLAIPGIAWDRSALTRLMVAGDRKLDQIEARLPVMSVQFAELAREDVCAAIFEHCLPYAHDQDHWRRLDRTNVQIDVPALFAEMAASRRALENLTSSARRRMLFDLTARAPIKKDLAWQL